VTQKTIAAAGLALAVFSAIATAVAAHADVGARVDQTTRRLDRVESAVEDIQWNLSLLCERSGATGCRTP
jgi:hypothetical protein